MSNSNTQIGTEISNVLANDIPSAPSVSASFTVGSYSNPFLQMAYGGGNSANKTVGTEYRLQRLERGQKVIRRGRVTVSVPQFRSQSFVSQTTANNPFTANTVSGTNFTPGSVPDSIAPTAANSNIRIPRTIDNA